MTKDGLRLSVASLNVVFSKFHSRINIVLQFHFIINSIYIFQNPGCCSGYFSKFASNTDKVTCKSLQKMWKFIFCENNHLKGKRCASKRSVHVL